jgi:translation initiation factor 2-alpha kinase 4
MSLFTLTTPGVNFHKGVFYDKAYEFITAVKSPLPLFALDAPQTLLTQLALDTGWMTDDDAWRTLVASVSFDRQYGDIIKDTLREWGQKSGPFVWLFSVREGKVRICVFEEVN